MEAYQTMSWKELQDEYYKNMAKFDESINSLETASNEIQKIYSQAHYFPAKSWPAPGFSVSDQRKGQVDVYET